MHQMLRWFVVLVAVVILGAIGIVGATAARAAADGPAAAPKDAPKDVPAAAHKAEVPAPANPFEARLEKAKATYKSKVDRCKADLVKDLDAKEASVRAKGDKDAVDKIKADRAAFAEKGRLPKTVSTTAYETRMSQATDELAAVYAAVIRELVKQKQDDRASALQTELAAFRAGGEIGWTDLFELAEWDKNDSPAHWKRDADGGATVNCGGAWSPLVFRGVVPEEYDMEVAVSRLGGNDCFEIGVVWLGHRCFFLFDAKGGSGIVAIDGKADNETACRVPIFHDNGPTKLRVIARKSGLSAVVDGKQIFKFTGKPERLTDNNYNLAPGCIFLSAAPGGSFKVTSARIKPVAGKGKTGEK